MTEELFKTYGSDTAHRIQGIFASIFILQNRMQTAGEKIQTQISMKQWLLLAMAGYCPEPATLTKLGQLMGCSRQNVKKLAAALEQEGYIRLVSGKGRSVCVELTEQAAEYSREMEERHAGTLQRLFADFTEAEIEELFRLYVKLYRGVARVEAYGEELARGAWDEEK